MANRHGCVFLKQQTRDRPSHDLAAAYNARVGAGDFDLISFEQLDNSRGRARHKSRPAHRQQPDIRGMKSVDIFFRRHCLDDHSLINMPWQWQLHQNSIRLLVLIQIANYFAQLFGRCRFRQINLPGTQSNFSTCTNLIANVNDRSVIIANQHGCQTRLDAALVAQPSNFVRNFAFDLIRDGTTFEDLDALCLHCSHRS